MIEGETERTEGAWAACERFDAVLADYLEGETRPEVASHARECASCAALLEDIGAIRSAAAEPVLEVPPARLWANLRLALAEEGLIREPRASWARRLFAYNLLLRPTPVAVLASLVLLAGVLWRAPQVLQVFSRSRVSSGSGTASRRVGTLPVAWSADDQLTRTVRDMELRYRAHAASLEPGMQVTFQEGLRSLNEEIRDCQNSILRQPSDTLAERYLSNAYQQKAEVLESALEFAGR